MPSPAHPGPSSARRWLLAVLLLAPLVAALASPAARAQSCAAEVEPNDAEADAQPLAGEFCLAASLPADDQDLVLWEVDAGTAAAPVTISLEGVPNTLTTARLLSISSEPGVEPVVAGPQLLELSANPADTAPATLDVLVPAGRYLLGVSRTGTPDASEPTTTGYTLRVSRGDALDGAPEVEPNDDAGTAMAVGGAFSAVGDTEGSIDVFAWRLTEEDDDRGWEIHGQVPIGVSVELSLLDEGGAFLTSVRADPSGRLALYDLALASGTYGLSLSGPTDVAHPYRLEALPIERPEADREPNDTAAFAVDVDLLSGPARGRLTAGDEDDYRLTVDEDAAGSLLDVKVIRRSEANLSLCLADSAGSELQCKQGRGSASLTDIALPAGEYVVQVGGDPEPDTPYLLRVDVTSARSADFESEPNDTVAVASPLEPAGAKRGVFTGRETDVFRVTMTGDPQLWQVEVDGAGVEQLSLQDANGRYLATSAPASGAGSARLTDLYLPPGDHWLSVHGADGEYTVRLVPLGPPDPNGEREANNDRVLAELILVGGLKLGRIVDTSDDDVFRFSLASADHVLIDLTAPADAALDLTLTGEGTALARWAAAAPGEDLHYDGMLAAGDYLIQIGGRQGSEERYELTLGRADPFLVAADQEPNGHPLAAGVLPAEGEVRGDLALANDTDWYALPAPDGGDLEVTLEGDGAVLRLTDGVTDYAVAADDTGKRWTAAGPFPPDAPLYLVVSGTGDYRLSLGGAGTSILGVPVGPAVGGPEPPPVTATLTLGATEVGAFLSVAQRVEGELALTNDGQEAVTLDLLSATSHYAWAVELGQAAVDLAPGETVSVPVVVTVQADAWVDIAVRVTVAGRDASGGLVTAFVEITPTAAALPVEPEPSWPIPEPLLGGLDVAALSLGATLVAPVDPAAEAQLHDGITPAGAGFLSSGPVPIVTTVDLAGDAPQPVAGFVLINPPSFDGLSAPARGVEVALSTDGVTFEPVWSGELQPLGAEQAIVLDQPVEAAFARLTVTSAHGADPFGAIVTLGEWKVVAAPGATPEPYLAANVASGALGGHIVLLDPQGSDDATLPLSLLDEDPAPVVMWVEPGVRPSFVLGFHNDRAARISELQWVDPTGSLPDRRMDELTVEVSVDSPFGPWTPLASWRLERAADGSVAPLVLDEVTWARFVRLTAGAVPDGDFAVDIELPATLRVIEQAPDDGYRSILGEWGANRPEGPYERLNPVEAPVAPDEPDAPDEPGDALPLAAGEPVAGRANIGADVDWYTVTIPDGQNTLTLDLTGSPVVDVTVEVFDADQRPVPVSPVAGDSPGSLRYTAPVEPGATYTVRIAQPAHSIVFAFDTSGSMGPYYDAVMQAVRSYSSEVTEGVEYVNVFSLAEDPLLTDWSDDPYEISAAVSRFRVTVGTSSAEQAVLDATGLLAGQDGTKAILIITDGETSSYPVADDMWRALGAVQPRVFAVQVGALSSHNQSQDWMQDWAVAGDGYYQYTRSQADMDRAFARAATWLRRPAAYGLSYSTSLTSTEPGTLRVVSPAVDEAAGEESVSTISANVSVEIIYDTSGSMLAPMPDGTRRVDAARAVLVDLVTNRIPAGVPVALRVFGTTPGSCDTQLAVPLAPLDPAAMGAAIAAIEPVNEVKTPLGASLDQVANDLSGAEGPKIVILVTDGEETCDGDAEAAIERLAAEGVDVQVNIVGFALDDEELKRTFRRWARLGNGTYFDATSAEELDEAITRAVQAPFRVYDADGELVDSGTVDGGSVRLPPGVYRVAVLTEPETVYEEVVVEPEGEVTLTLGEPPP